MIAKSLTLKFGILLIITLVVWAIISFAARAYWKDVPEKSLKSDYLKVPINNTLSVMGIVCPLLIAVAAYLYVNLPTSDFSYILASIADFTAALIIAIWETFSLLGKATTDDNIKLSWANDSAIIRCMGILYSSLILGVVYLVLFFLLDLSILPPAQPQSSATNGIALTKPLPRIGQSKSDIVSALGAPTKTISPDTLVYEGSGVDLQLQFDNTGALQKITEQRH